MTTEISIRREFQDPARNRVLNIAIPSDVKKCFLDPDRLSPTMAGMSRLQGNVLLVRSAVQDVEIRAPKILLAQIFRLCDGTRTVNEVLQQLPPRFLHEEFSQFIDFLLMQGALIDANLVTVNAARYAFQGSPYGLAAESVITNQICRRFLWNKEGAAAKPPATLKHVKRVPLQDVFGERVSTYTFDEKPISERALLALLWSIAGVVAVEHERVGFVTPKRTIASAGGMQLVKVFVALQKAVGSYRPGVYRVAYPDAQVVALEFLGEEHKLLPRAFGKPWEVTYATGAVFLAAAAEVAAMRYRNRALQYLFMEAGAALHNGGLSASQLGLGFATIGGYYETIVSRLCKLEGDLVLGSAIFGAKPTAEQLGLVKKSADLDFAWVDGESARFTMPFHLARARVKTLDNNRPYTWGRDVDPWLALRKASAEAIEREGFREPRDLTHSSLKEAQDALDPTFFVKYSDGQYSNPAFPYQKFDPNAPCLWTSGVDLASGRTARVLAELVFSRSSLAPYGNLQNAPFSQVTSSGCAAGTSLKDATLRALLEVIERDAFMRHWLAQIPGEIIGPARLPAAIRRRIKTLEDAGCRIVVQSLDSSWANVCLVAAQHEVLHFTTMGTAASSDFGSALEAALDEAEARIYAWIHGHESQIACPSAVSTTEHHFELYGLKRYFRRADQVLFPNAISPVSRRKNFTFSTSEQLADRFATHNRIPIAVDITPACSHVDQGRTRIFVVKALVSELVPISFGYQREPLGMVPRVHPGSKFPHPFP